MSTYISVELTLNLPKKAKLITSNPLDFVAEIKLATVLVAVVSLKDKYVPSKPNPTNTIIDKAYTVCVNHRG